MPQLIVRDIEEKVVSKLKERAGRHGISMEEEHRRILREALTGKKARKGLHSKEYLLRMPDVGSDDLFERQSDKGHCQSQIVSGYLLDTNVISETRKRRRANQNVLTWFESVEGEELYLSVLVLGEIRKGIEKVRPADPLQARSLEQWLNILESSYSDRILPITTAIADEWGRLSAIRPLSTVDGLLAATALVHDLTLVTRNEQHISHTRVKFLNPFES